MITIIEAILGSKLGRIVAEILAVVLLIGSYTLYVKHEGASAELAKLKASSTTLIAKAQKDIQDETAAHTADVKANGEKTNAVLAANANLQSQLAERVRDFDAYRKAHPGVPRPVSGPVTASGGECGATSCGDLASQLAKVGDQLAASNGALSAELQSCQRDRDSLTGLPRETK